MKGGGSMANADFERLTDFLSRMIEKYGDELLKEIQDIEETKEKQKEAG